jgi:tripartite-type tricarboxylate transporter receptor subunit TctC
MVGFTPGGNIRRPRRAHGRAFLEKIGGQQIIVVNRPGAGGMIMLNEVLAAAPDGRIAALVSLPALVTVSTTIRRAIGVSFATSAFDR